MNTLAERCADIAVRHVEAAFKDGLRRGWNRGFNTGAAIGVGVTLAVWGAIALMGAP